MNIIHQDKKDQIRINKYLSECGFCSRREADRLVKAGRVIVNNQIASIGMTVTSQDVVMVDKQIVELQKKFVYLILNKPVGITCITDLSIRDNIINFMNYPERIFPVGRLDKDSEGLIIMTNDGDIVNKILRSENNHEKEYFVVVDKDINDDFIKGMENGVPILKTMTKKCVLQKISNNSFKIIITQGLNRQIRRMCRYFDYRVLKLQRIRIMNIKLNDLPIGKYRHLTIQELTELNKLIKNSHKSI